MKTIVTSSVLVAVCVASAIMAPVAAARGGARGVSEMRSSSFNSRMNNNVNTSFFKTSQPTSSGNFKLSHQQYDHGSCHNYNYWSYSRPWQYACCCESGCENVLNAYDANNDSSDPPQQTPASEVQTTTAPLVKNLSQNLQDGPSRPGNSGAPDGFRIGSKNAGNVKVDGIQPATIAVAVKVDDVQPLTKVIAVKSDDIQLPVQGGAGNTAGAKHATGGGASVDQRELLAHAAVAD